MPPLVSYVIATYNRKESLRRAINSICAQQYSPIEVVVISNSTDGTSELFTDKGPFNEENIRHFQFEGRMGVTRARNIGYDKARGEILVTIDDDAVLTDLTATSEIVAAFEEHDSLGIAAFKIINYHTGEVEFPRPPSDLESLIPLISPPMKPPSEVPANEPSEVPTFTGCGNAIHRSVLNSVGNYPSEFMYGSEELDLTLRVIDEGYRVLYLPSVTVIHYEDPAGRFEDDEILRRFWENKMRIAIRRLPWKHALKVLILMSARTLYRSKLNFKLLMFGGSTLLQEIPDLLTDRDPIHEDTIRYMKTHGGRLY